MKNPKLFSPWIRKFPSSADAHGEVSHQVSLLARTLKAIARPGDLGHRDERMKRGKERVVNQGDTGSHLRLSDSATLRTFH